MYKLIATDLDETLLQSDKHVSIKDVETIKKLEDVKFVLATGRGFLSIQNTLKEIGLFDKTNEYTISYNGAVICENKDNKIIHLQELGYKHAQRLFDVGLNYDVCIHVYTLDNCYTYRMFDNERQYLNNRIQTVEFDSKDISFLANEPILKVLYCSQDFDYLKQIKKELNLDNEYDVSLSANRYLEFNLKGVNKGNALIKLAEYLNIDVKDTIAVGDSLNDLTMIQKAGLGIGVKNATQEIINDCDVILDSTNNESPITEIYERYIKTED